LPRIARGEKEAVQACIDRYGGLVWSLVRRQLRDQSEAEDLVQEIFLDVWRSAGRFDPSVASETTFVAMIARRRLIDRSRRVRGSREKTVLDDVAPAGIEGEQIGVAQDGEATRAVEAFGKLSPDQQRVLRLSIQQGLSHENIAGALGMPLGTVKTHARRGLIRLRKMMAGEGDE